MTVKSFVAKGLVGAVAGMVWLAAPARADDNSDACFNKTGQEAITGCTRAIQSGKFKGSGLAVLYNNRGIEERQLRDFDRAIADYTQAIRFDSDFTGAYAGRGLAWEGKGDIEKAKTDYRKALTVKQKYNDGKWAHDTSRDRLAALEKKDAPAAPSGDSASGGGGRGSSGGSDGVAADGASGGGRK
jgi:tetratricopeptide (TPR) repeat protein